MYADMKNSFRPQALARLRRENLVFQRCNFRWIVGEQHPPTMWGSPDGNQTRNRRTWRMFVPPNCGRLAQAAFCGGRAWLASRPANTRGQKRRGFWVFERVRRPAPQRPRRRAGTPAPRSWPLCLRRSAVGLSLACLGGRYTSPQGGGVVRIVLYSSTTKRRGLGQAQRPKVHSVFGGGVAATVEAFHVPTTRRVLTGRASRSSAACPDATRRSSGRSNAPRPPIP